MIREVYRFKATAKLLVTLEADRNYDAFEKARKVFFGVLEKDGVVIVAYDLTLRRINPRTARKR